ncbi:thimet oligopeptidase [Lophiostoma macrostomum CBS 122681]|uniref:Thimet oligopeptidase n=1 Tax=Lophiostoma macrostomum CBS 122681 TaxID=1314788 RepID=A0A6A6SU28_9PLEO|nr:thimet oligopeptidase [Lophiostoma macrostomum CBS 122681]
MFDAEPFTPPQAAPSFIATPNSIISDAKRIIAHIGSIQDGIIRNETVKTATFSSVVLPLAHAEDTRRLESNILCFYRDVSPDAELRKASNEAHQLIIEFDLESSMRQDLFQLYDAIVRKNEDLDPESDRLLKRQHQNFLRNGLGLSREQQRQRFKEIGVRLNQLKQVFRTNQMAKSDGIWFSRTELEGLSKHVLDSLEQENDGKLWLTFEYHHLIPTLRYVKQSETRKQCYIGFENKCKANVAVFNETIVLRDEAARLLGYPNHATFRVEEKMVKTAERANRFLSELRSKLSDYGLRELERLKAVKKKDLGVRGVQTDDRFYLWETEFYKNLLVEQEYQVDQRKIAEYFPLAQVLSGLLDVFELLFGLRFEEFVEEDKKKDIVWHEDVRPFAIWNSEDEGGDFVGYLYMDLFVREGKLEQPFNVNLQPGFSRADGTCHRPSTALICSFPKGQTTRSTLLTHPELITLFHELGHGIHDLVSVTQHSHFHGTNVALDFGEAPSQMLEHWCWNSETLKSLSYHYATSEKIPEDMLQNLLRTRYVHSALFHLRTLQLSTFDLMVHQPSTHEEIKNMNTSIAWNTVRKKIMQIDGPEVLGQGYAWGHGQGNFGHAMDEYDAGMYSYLYAQVIADDLFATGFAPNPMDSQAGRKYRHAVLEKGGSQDEMATVVGFLGREPSMDAFYKNLGVI